MSWPKRRFLRLRPPWLARGDCAILALAILSGSILAGIGELYRRDWLNYPCGIVFLLSLFFISLFALRWLNLSPACNKASGSQDPAVVSLRWPDPGAPPSGWLLCLGLLSIYGLALGKGSLFFSDDSLRHELDGYYILRNLPLYCMSPLELGGPGGVPNHPDLATIYLPGTQLLALLGALTGGYRSIFVITSLLMMVWLLRRRRMFAALFAHPLLMIVYFSGHVDFTALLLCLIALENLLKQRAGTLHPMGRFSLTIVSGSFWILACAMKPEALLVLLPMIALWLSNAKSRVPALTGFCIGAFLTAGLLFYFTIFDLFHIGQIERLQFFSASEGSSLEFECFFYTAKIFSDYFVAYRPDAMLLVNQGLSSSESIRLVRMLWLAPWALFAGWFAFSRLLLWRQKLIPSIGCHPPLVRISLELAASFLIGYFLFRGSWQPWYFIWFLVALPLLPGGAGLRWAICAMSLLLLCYLPVIKYRVDGSFDLSFFYMSFLLASTGGAMVYFWNKKSAYGK